MNEYQKIKAGKAWTVSINEDCAVVYWQTINPKTGKGWQAHRDLRYFAGERYRIRAMRAWLYAGATRPPHGAVEIKKI
ncbi:MAG TPA: hypothetical protein P5102_15510 [Candidatus Competibacteraceae bacterium]|nr:hypothetical protein [Candidatus Competibacteraceae bacterium]HSA47765.1 hypothetical protein [Candidatus Competibacteraceae bacterium]